MEDGGNMATIEYKGREFEVEPCPLCGRAPALWLCGGNAKSVTLRCATFQCPVAKYKTRMFPCTVVGVKAAVQLWNTASRAYAIGVQRRE